MTQIFLFISLISNASAQKARWEILGIQEEKKLIAFRSFYIESGEEEQETYPCKYPGVPNKSEGVELGVWSIPEAKVVQSWTIYESVFDREDCTQEKKAKKELAAAKTWYAENGLDITTPPTGVESTDEANEGRSVYEVVDAAGKKHPYELLVFEDLKIPNDPMGYLLKRWIRAPDWKVIYTLELECTNAMASGMRVDYPAAYRVGGQVVFLERRESTSMRHHDISYAFTPPADLK
jgi:hypothetical protein